MVILHEAAAAIAAASGILIFWFVGCCIRILMSLYFQKYSTRPQHTYVVFCRCSCCQRSIIRYQSSTAKCVQTMRHHINDAGNTTDVFHPSQVCAYLHIYAHTLICKGTCRGSSTTQLVFCVLLHLVLTNDIDCQSVAL